MERKLYRSAKNKMLGGVSAGVGDYLGVDPIFIRLFFVITALGNGFGFWLYLALWIFLEPAPTPESAPAQTDWDNAGEELSRRARLVESDVRQAVRQPHPQASLLAGGTLIALGVFTLVDNLGFSLFRYVDWDHIWPVVLILGGIIWIVRGVRGEEIRMVENNNKPNTSRLAAPIFLIALGVVILLNNMGLLANGVWDTVLSLWPALLIIWGLNSLYRREGIVWAAVLIAFGGVLLLSNLDVISISALSLVRFWPVLLIAVGLDVMLGRRSVIASVFGLLVTLLIFAGGLWYFNARVPGGGQTIHEISEVVGDYDTANVFLSPSVADLRVYPLVDSRSLIEGTYTVLDVENFTQEFNVDERTAVFRLESDTENVNVAAWNNLEMNWDIGLNSSVPISLKIELGVGASNIDLAGLQISALSISAGVGESVVELASGNYWVELDTGIGQTTIVLPEQGILHLDVNGGIGEVVIRVPEGMAVKVHTDRGISGLQVPDGYIRNGDMYQSPGFATSENQVEIFIDLGIGNISIQEN